MNQLYIGIDAIPKIKKAAVEVLTCLGSKLASGDPLTLQKLLEISFAKQPAVDESVGEESKEELEFDETKV